MLRRYADELDLFPHELEELLVRTAPNEARAKTAKSLGRSVKKAKGRPTAEKIGKSLGKPETKPGQDNSKRDTARSVRKPDVVET